ncbi:hypothetical protein GGI18_000316 [Coemansia linderi]|uniref:Uncharacterized protein n=1 Tax=Coemansia linderi TaxID=2663919 RepID=A0ACC1KPT9_9FUNG|nr:hypothetical protein GGI18_000316 [Coemansia linderi]
MFTISILFGKGLPKIINYNDDNVISKNFKETFSDILESHDILNRFNVYQRMTKGSTKNEINLEDGDVEIVDGSFIDFEPKEGEIVLRQEETGILLAFSTVKFE